MATPDAQDAATTPESLAEKPVAVYRQSLWRRLFPLVALAMVIALVEAYGSPRLWILVVGAGVVADLLHNGRRWELSAERIRFCWPLGLRTSTVRFGPSLRVEESAAPWWRPWARGLRITDGSCEMVVPDWLPGYWDLRRKLRAIQERREPSQHDPAESA